MRDAIWILLPVVVILLSLTIKVVADIIRSWL